MNRQRVMLAELNAATRDRFVEAIGWVFEDSPWVAERAWIRRPFESVRQLQGAMVAELTVAGREQQLTLLRAHPDLGARARMSDASTGEQASAGLDSLTPPDFERIQRLNADYRRKFGFPFLFAVKGSTARDVVAALERRLLASEEEEFREALRQVARIAAFRLEDAVRSR